MSSPSPRVKLIRAPEGYLSVATPPSKGELEAYYNEMFYGDSQKGLQYADDYTEDEIAHKYLDGLEAESFAAEGAKSLLEIGAGEGFTLKHFADRGWEVRGIDFTEDGIQRFFPDLRDRLVVGDAYQKLDLELESGAQYDLIICNHVLEHTLDPKGLLERIRGLLSPIGVCRIVVPNDGSWLHDAIVAKGYAEPEFFVNYPEHLHYFTADPLRRLLQSAGFEVRDLLGEFPIDMFLLNPDSCYTLDKSKGKNCHYARVAFELALMRRSVEELVAYRRGCAAAGIGRSLVIYGAAKS